MKWRTININQEKIGITQNAKAEIQNANSFSSFWIKSVLFKMTIEYTKILTTHITIKIIEKDIKIGTQKSWKASSVINTVPVITVTNKAKEIIDKKDPIVDNVSRDFFVFISNNYIIKYLKILIILTWI